MRVALVFCPFGGNGEQPPAGITHLAAALRDAHAVDVFDLAMDFRAHCREVGDDYLAMEGYDYEKIRELEDTEVGELETVAGYAAARGAMLAASYDLVGFSLFTSNLSFSARMMAEIRRRDPTTRIVAGGPSCDLAAAAPEIMALHLEGAGGRRHLVDAAVVGEGERAFRALVDAAAAGEDLAGLPGVLTDRSPRPEPPAAAEPCDLDALPFPDYSAYDLSRYTDPILPVVASRGCIYRCRYCAERGLWGRYRSRSPESVLAEIRFHLERCGVPFFHFSESLFNGHIPHLRRLCELIAESGLEFGWYGMAAIRREMDRDLTARLRASGCAAVLFGLESGSDRLLREMGKTFDSALASRVLADSRRAGFSVEALLFVGYPGETEEDLQATMDFLRRNQGSLDKVHLAGTCRIGPRSYLLEHSAELGIVGSGADWRLTDGTNTPAIREDRARRLREFCMDLDVEVR